MANAVIQFIQSLNNREIAIIVWLILAIIWILSQPKLKKASYDLIKAFFAWKLAVSYIMMFSYITFVLISLNALGIWRLTHLPNTVLWVLCVAFVMLFEFSKANDENFFKNAIKDNIKMLVVLEFIINLYVFALWVELLLVPICAIFGGMMAIADTDKKYAIVKIGLNYILSFFGLGLIFYASYMVAVDFRHFASYENFEAFYLPIVLTYHVSSVCVLYRTVCELRKSVCQTSVLCAR